MWLNVFIIHDSGTFLTVWNFGTELNVALNSPVSKYWVFLSPK